MKLKNKLLLATSVSLAIYVFFVYLAMQTFLYPGLLKSEISKLYDKEKRAASILLYELQNLEDFAKIFAILLKKNGELNFLNSSDLPNNIDFVYILNSEDSDKNYIINNKIESNLNNKIEKIISNYLSENLSENQTEKLRSSGLFQDIIKTDLGDLLISGDLSNKNKIIVGQFISSNIIKKISKTHNFNLTVLLDNKVIKIIQDKKNKINKDKLQKVIIDDSRVKTYYLVNIGNNNKQVVIEISTNKDILFHANIVLIFTFLATIISGPLALLFLLLIVRIIQSHEV